MNSISIDRTSRVFTSVGFIGRFGYMRVVMNMTEWSESWWTTEVQAKRPGYLCKIKVTLRLGGVLLSLVLLVLLLRYLKRDQ